MFSAAPRLLPDEPLPAYAFVPGRFPHPVSDPAGHSHGQTPAAVVALDPADWAANRAYLRGFDLFNHGYYWEAHEAWEALWHAAGRRGPVGLFLQGLIRLAAAGVKVRQGQARGTVGHARAAAARFRQVRDLLGDPSQFLGLPFAHLLSATALAESGATDQPDPTPGVRVVFPFTLLPGVESAPPS